MSSHKEIATYRPAEYTGTPEDILEIPDGIYFPISGIFGDYARAWTKPSSGQIFRSISDVMGIIGSENQISFRGSTAMYKLLVLAGAEKRGTLSTALNMGMIDDLELESDSMAFRCFKKLINGSDFDFILRGVGDEEFVDVNESVWSDLKRVFEKNDDRNPPNNLVSKFGRRRGSRKQDDIKKNTEIRYLERSDGVVAGGIPYSQAEIYIDEEMRAGTVFWTADPVLVDGVMDTRLDPRYALSWDTAGCGDVLREIPEQKKKNACDAKRMADQEAYQPIKRTIHKNGVFPQAVYQEGQKDFWLHVSGESLSVLTKPIDTGSEFEALPVIDQLRLAVRACQKAAIGEENLKLSEDGVCRLSQNLKAPALSDRTIEQFNRIDVERFRAEYENLSDEDRISLQEELMSDMLVGFFYPTKFIGYLYSSGVNKFFPQLDSVNLQGLHDLSLFLFDHDLYSKMQYKATHFLETNLIYASDEYYYKYETNHQQRRNLEYLINPYMRVAGLMNINNADYDGNYLSYFESLLSLEVVENEKHNFDVPDIIEQIKDRCGVGVYELDNDMIDDIVADYVWLDNTNMQAHKLRSLVTKLSLVGAAGSGVLTGDEIAAASFLLSAGITTLFDRYARKHDGRTRWLLTRAREIRESGTQKDWDRVRNSPKG